MNKKALLAVLLAAMLPLVCYFIVKRYSESAVNMPRHYYEDSVVQIKKNGKKIDDTIWHKLPDITMVNQLGDSVSWAGMSGKIVIADFFFTHCPSICPLMTRNMKRLQESINNGQRVGDRTNKQVHFLSFSIDPERDSVPRLKYWADRFQVDPEQWWLITGDKKEIYDLCIKEIRLGLEDGKGVDTNFIHSSKFVLIDTNRYVRGFYDGLDSTSLSRLSNDLVLLTLEKDPKGKSFFAGKLQMLAVVVLSAIIGVGLFLFIFQKKKKHVTSGLEEER